MRSFGQLFLVGVAGLVGAKVFGGVALPLFGLMFGLLAFAVKMILIGAAVYWVVNFFKGRNCRRDSYES